MSLLIGCFFIAPIVDHCVWRFCVEALFYGMVLSVHSSSAIILLRKKELVA